MEDKKYCTNCGSTKLHFVGTYANGDFYQCQDCKQESSFDEESSEEEE